MWVLSHVEHETHVNELYSCMHAKNSIAPYSISVRNQEQKSWNILRSYPEMINYFLKEIAEKQAIAGYDAWILEYMQQSSMTLQQNADDIIAKSCRVANVYDECKQNNVFIEDVD